MPKTEPSGWRRAVFLSQLSYFYAKFSRKKIPFSRRLSVTVCFCVVLVFALLLSRFLLTKLYGTHSEYYPYNKHELTKFISEGFRIISQQKLPAIVLL